MKNPALLEKPTFLWRQRSWDDFKAASAFTKINYLNFVLLIVFVVMAIRQVRAKQDAAKKAGYEKRYIKAPEFPEVEEQPDFDLDKTEPLKLRPFKPKFHLTMALENLDPTDLLLMDNTYASRIKYRQTIMSTQGKHAVDVHDDVTVRPAVVELYQYLMGTYLPLRFPTMFKLHETDYEQGKTFMLENLVTKAIFPAIVAPQTKTTTLLETLGRTVDEDFLFLHPEEGEDVKDPKYVLQAYVCICPSGWDPVEKLGLRLASIHTPVPKYSDKLEASMDRYFAALPVGKYVQRKNWSISTSPELFAIGKNSNHAKKGDKLVAMTDDELDPDSTVLRCERQTLHRLPKSKSLVFAFKTYTYPIKQIKEEGTGPELADAVDGLKSGSVEAMHWYKRGAVWGEAVKKYLRS
ncbi:hypothetical protein PV10_02638 [Exophiala mesophila]|uniref:Uncharacterized protein n=1 Tax=Exophiala mesophila TaxID=212818 RepID=A0A0D2A7F5_EXOME|nr:uncharacterized protein PV10_02638 [Exophiala mesophila]KIV94918.1 hypothetical protein PV10_02638 [Exophiala mesophila]